MLSGVGILGFAHAHVQSYCQRWQADPSLGVAPVAGWDHDAERLQAAVDAFGVAPCARVADLLARPDVAAVVVAAETARHAELVEQAAAAGKTIVLQKPVALTLAEADRIVAAVRQHNVRFSMAWQMRVDPQNVKIKELIADRSLGRVFMLRRRHGLDMCLRPEFADSWHVSAADNRDMWADDAAHPIDFVYWLFGAPESVTAEIESLHDPRMPMDNGIVIFRYPGGPLVEVCCSFTNRAGENTTEVVCANGSIIQNYGDVPSCNVPRPDGAPGLKWFDRDKGEWVCSDIPTPAGHGERIAGLAAPLAAFIGGKRDPVATAEEGRAVLRMTLACYVSVREGRRVPLSDPLIEAV